MLGFYVSPIAKVIRRRDLGLKSHPKDCNREADFTIWIAQSLYFLNPKFQASSHLLWSYSPVCGGPGRKSGRPVFSQRGSNNLHSASYLVAF